MTFQGSRILNESSSLFGLSIFDIGVIGYGLIILHALVGILSFLICACIAVALIQIRLTQRRKIIRDTLNFYLLPKVLFFYQGK